MSNNSVQFTVPGEPQGKGRPRFTTYGGHARAITPDKTVLYENLIKTAYISKYGQDSFPAGVPLSLDVVAYYSIPTSASKKKNEMMKKDKIMPTKKPDADNILKVVADSLNKIAYYDDAQIVLASISKRYSDTPGLLITISEV